MYYILVVIDCTPQTIEKETKEEVQDYLTSFVLKYGSLDDGDANWIDQIFEGRKVDFALKIELSSNIVDDEQVVS